MTLVELTVLLAVAIVVAAFFASIFLEAPSIGE